MTEESSNSLEYTPTWVVAVVCFVIVLISLCVERALHKLGKWLVRKDQDALFQALQKLQEELMLLGFISLLLTVFQDAISHICIPPHLASIMLPCKRETVSHEKYSLGAINIQRQLLSTDTNSEHCANMGKVPMLSLEALHHLHIFIFVLAVVHVIFCATTMVLGGMKMRQWKHWEDSIKRKPQSENVPTESHHREFFSKRAMGYWRKAAVVSWLISFFKQFHGSVTKSDYITLREGFRMTHFPANHSFDFHKYMMRRLKTDFRKVVGIRCYLWLFVVIFLLLNLEGWHTFFWLSFLPLVLLLLVGAKLEHVITRLAQELKKAKDQEEVVVNPSDDHFWFRRPDIVLHLIHFILFQNSFEIAFFFWILCTYGFHSCIMEKLGYLIPRLIIGVIVQVLCSYSTLPLYALVTQMGSKYRFSEKLETSLTNWVERRKRNREGSDAAGSQMDKMARESCENVLVAEEMVGIDGGTMSIVELSCLAERQTPSP